MRGPSILLRSAVPAGLVFLLGALAAGAVPGRERRAPVRNESGAPFDTVRIQALTGAHTSTVEDGRVVQLDLPRPDLAVSIAGIPMSPGLGIESDASFMRAGRNTMVMAEVVALDDQVNQVLDAALNNGLEVTAIHNHYLSEQPRVMFLHLAGTGREEVLAQALGKVFAASREPGAPLAEARVQRVSPAGPGGVPAAPPAAPPATSPAVPPAAAQLPDSTGAGIGAQAPGGRPAIGEARAQGTTSPAPGWELTLDAARLDAALGGKGRVEEGAYRVEWSRSARLDGMPIDENTGVENWASFAGSDARAFMVGEFSLKQSELQPFLKALRGNGLEISAIHNHMAGEEPRLFFVHCRGLGPIAELARGLRTALERTGISRG